MKKEQIGNATLYCADCKDVLPLLEDIDSDRDWETLILV